jgi:hypothetical protein
MRNSSFLLTAALLLGPVSSVTVIGAEKTATVVATATFAPRTSLRVSTQVLRFEVPVGATEGTASVDFSAGVRVSPGSEVVLTVEPLRSPDGPGGAADVETVISFSGEGAGTESGTLRSSPSVAARWSGGGLRQGRLVFTLHADAPGVYVIPVRFLLAVA